MRSVIALCLAFGFLLTCLAEDALPQTVPRVFSPEVFCMDTVPLALAPSEPLPDWLAGDSPGIFLSGAPGSGKSVALENLERAIILAPGQPGLLKIDPHGTGARSLRRWCLNQGRSVASRVRYYEFSNTGRIPSVNVLHVPGTDVGSIAWYGRLAVITELVGKILLAAWGETDFNSKPILFKNVFRIMYTLAHAGLSLADAKLFLNLEDPIYRHVLRAVPDVIARQEMEALPDMRESDRLAQIESCKNRFLGLLSNPVIELALGRVDGALTFQQLYDERAIVIVNLETAGDSGGVLRTMDQEILANLFLTLAIYHIMNTRDRHLQFLSVDELPVFKSSADILTFVNLPQSRKFLVRTLAAAQGSTLFVDRTDDRLLHAFLAMCKTKLFFRHNSAIDCSFFGQEIALPDYSPTRVKYAHYQPMQFQEGNEVQELTDVSQMHTATDTEGASHKTGRNQVANWNDTATTSRSDHKGETRDDNLLRQAVTEARADVAGRQTGRGGASGTTEENATNRSHAESSSRGITKKQQLVPIINTHDVCTSVTFYTKEELDATGATTLARLATGEAILLVAGHSPVKVQFPLTADPYAWAPKFAKKKEAEHQAQLWRRPEFATADVIQKERQLLLQALLRRLEALPSQQSRAGQLIHASHVPEARPIIIDDSSPLSI